MPETVPPITNPPTATEISAGPEHYFRIAAVSQREAWLKFEFEEGKTYQVDVRSAGKTLSKGLPDPGVELRTWDADTLLDLFSPGEVIISDKDSGSGNNAALFFHNDLATGTFYLKVFDENQDFGRFNIQIREIDIAPGPEDDKNKTQLLSSVGTLYSDGWEGLLKIGDINGELGTPTNKFPFPGG